MRPPNFRPTNIGVYTLPGLPDAETTAVEIMRFLEEAGIQTFLCTSRSDECLRRQMEEGAVDLMVALGGDGTMLRAGHLCAPHGVPVLGINLGHFGFLTEIERDGWRKLFPQLLEGNFRIEDRMMLKASHRRGSQTLAEWQVINEVVVCRGQFVRPIRVRASVDGYLLSAYVADGLIAATATGSTAYALAVGGPIMPPELHNILIIPIAPHLSIDRGIILPEGAHVTITALTNHEAVVSVDGQSPVTVLDGDEVDIEASSHVVSFVRFQDPGYFYRNLTYYMEQNPVTGNRP
jgi:NAD+ kinase